MGLDFAIDELYSTGWSTLDSTGCGCGADGRMFPGVDRVRAEFEASGFKLSIHRVELFDCYRAEWRLPSGEAVGAVVGQSEAEAAVYALSRMRRAAATCA
ncbi:MAG: hypothetical protein JNK58_03335 [Phycisphaerae bacterium]|nr:hypothetical protein [Phycisphaerae bacterium]